MAFLSLNVLIYSCKMKMITIFKIYSKILYIIVTFCNSLDIRKVIPVNQFLEHKRYYLEENNTV
jgi:hypothetical protein